MTQREAARFMITNGFTLYREGKHLLWTDGTTRIVTRRGDYDVRNERNLIAEVKRAIRARPVSAPIPTNTERAVEKEKEKELRVKFAEAIPNGALRPAPLKQQPMPITQGAPAMSSSAPKASFKKYDGATRARVWGRIRELVLQGKSHHAAANIMELEGFKLPDGETPVDYTYVSRAMHNMRANGMLPPIDEPKGTSAKLPPMPGPTPVAAAAPAPKRPGKLPDFVVSILTDPELSDTQKVRMLAAYAEL